MSDTTTNDTNDTTGDDAATNAASSDVTPNPEKDPADWVTGDEPMTGAQRSYLQTLKQEAGEEFDSEMTKADASREIDRLQEQTGRGADT